MDLLDKFFQELNEATYSKVTKKGDFRVITPKNKGGGEGDSSDQDPGGEDQEGEDQSGGEGREGQESGGEGQESGGEEPGEQGEGEGEKGGKKKVSFNEDGQVVIDGETVGPKITDDHSEQKGGNVDDFDDIIRKVYDEVKERAQTKQGGSGEGGKGGLIERVEEYLKPKFNVKPILKRLDDFKRLIGKQIVEAKYDSYSAAQHNPASQRGDMMRPMKIPGGKAPDIVKESAVLIFAADTSGSITRDDYKFIFGFLRKIAEHFEKPLDIRNDQGEKVGTMTGEIYLLEWDHGVHLPIRKWTQVSRNKVVKNITENKEKQAAEERLRGGGGNDMNKVFKTLDKLFYREIKGKPYFDLDETADYINLSRDIDKAEDNKAQKGAKKYRVRLKKQKRQDMKEISKDRIEQDVDLTPGEPNFMEGRRQVANVPFLIVYTDGYWAPANYTQSKLYADNPGNILYILTAEEGLENIRPVNVMFHDIHGQGNNNFKRFSKNSKE